MRKPRNFDAELKALEDKARELKTRKVQQLGELLGRDLNHWLALGATSGTSGVSRRVTPGG